MAKAGMLFLLFLAVVAIAIASALLPENHFLRLPSKPFQMDKEGGALRYSAATTVGPAVLIALGALWCAYDGWLHQKPINFLLATLFAAVSVAAFTEWRRIRVSWDARGIEGPGGGFGAPRLLIPWSSVAFADLYPYRRKAEGKKAWIVDCVWDSRGNYVSWRNCAGWRFLSDELRHRRPDLFEA